MILQITGKHFLGTDFNQPCDCAISKAMREYLQLNAPNDEFRVTECVGSVEISPKSSSCVYLYKHKPYYSHNFNNDYRAAERVGFDDTVIREIEIEGFNPVAPVDTLIDNALKTETHDTENQSSTLQRDYILNPMQLCNR